MAESFRDRVGEQFLAALDLFLARNRAYGNSAESIADRYAVEGEDPMLAWIPRLTDKYERIVNLTFHGEQSDGEAVIDTLNDLGTYAFMAAAYLSEPSADVCERVSVYDAYPLSHDTDIPSPTVTNAPANDSPLDERVLHHGEQVDGRYVVTFPARKLYEVMLDDARRSPL